MAAREEVRGACVTLGQGVTPPTVAVEGAQMQGGWNKQASEVPSSSCRKQKVGREVVTGGRIALKLGEMVEDDVLDAVAGRAKVEDQGNSIAARLHPLGFSPATIRGVTPVPSSPNPLPCYNQQPFLSPPSQS